MLSNLEAKATIQAANRIKALITAEQPSRAQTQRRDDESWREQRRRERQRREQELFGKHPLWRRITGITFVYEPIMRARERKKGIKRLIKWLEKQSVGWPSPERSEGWVSEANKKPQDDRSQTGDAAATEGGPDSSAIGAPQAHPTVSDPTNVECRFATPIAELSGPPGDDQSALSTTTPHPTVSDPTNVECRFATPIAELSGPPGDNQSAISATAPWDFAFTGWQRVRASGRSIESLCHELEMSRARLTTLTKELCGLSAQEIIDGFKIRKLRGALVEQLRAAARELWGAPGSYVWTKVDVPMKMLDPECEDEGPEASCSARSPNWAARLHESRAEEIARRTEELFQAMCHGQPLFSCPCDSRTGAPARLHGQPTTAARGTFDLEVLALQLGFASASRLKRACLTVLGRTLKQVQRMLAHEVVRYYICAEDKALRELALCDDNTRLTRRARLLYWGSDERPDEPFLDEWSKHEELAKDWLMAMWREYG